MDSFWPLSGLRLRHRDVLLRPTREADLAPLAAMLPGDVGHDPRPATFESQTFEENERRLFCQGYWCSMGNWDPAARELHFVVFHDGEPVGVQTLEGTSSCRTSCCLLPAACCLLPAARCPPPAARRPPPAARRPPADVSVTGLEAALPWFGR
ncbi:hypothetical protein ACIA5C_39845 [Actinoplanes sp. NPDC051343]|uniref:hypothetical protein n=1 Tax=Actinoplanes sp. NPDC051343 TaxID=3363906 RepID=UPI0037AF8FC1